MKRLIKKMTTVGSLVFSFDPNERLSRDLAWDGESLWMIDSLGTVRKFTTGGVLVDSVSSLFSSGWGLTYGGDHLWVSDPLRKMIYKTLINSLPEAFSLLQPPDSSLLVEDTIEIDWEDSYDPDSVLYCLYLSPDSTFTDTGAITVIDSLEESEYTLVRSSRFVSSMECRRGEDSGEPAKSIPDSTYHWKVKAYDQVGADRWSDRNWMFRLLSCSSGDCNGDGRITVADATYVVTYVYRGGGAPVCDCDVNGDGRVSVADALYLVTYVYRGGPPPGEPPAVEKAPAAETDHIAR